MDSLEWRSNLDVTGKLNALPLQEFIVVWRYVYDGETFEEIANATQTPRSTIFSQYQRALKRLAKPTKRKQP